MWDFSFQKESTNNHHWRPGSLGAGYITAPTNTPDSFDLLQMDVTTWVIGPDQTQDVHREYMRSRPVTPILFQFYISPTGGIHDGGKGFKNRTGKPVKAVINYLHRLDNRLYNGHDEIKVNRLSNAEIDSALHFNTKTGEPCYCGFGQSRKTKSLMREANLKYKDLKRGEVPKWMDEDEAQQLQKFLTAIVEGGTGYRATPGIKKIVPWLIQQLKTGSLKFNNGKNEDERFSRDPYFVIMEEGPNQAKRLGFDQLEAISNLFNAEDSPYRLKIDTCETCNGSGSYTRKGDQVPSMCEKCQGWGTRPSGNEKADLNQLGPNDIWKRTQRHGEWVEERKEIAENKERVKSQEVTHKFDNGWYVTKLNPSAEEAEWEGIAQGNCFQSDAQPYQSAVADGRLTVYVLRDKDGRGHALWAYDLNGNIAVMEDSSKMYNTEGFNWAGYRINNQWIRDMVSNANQAMGLDDTYSGYNHDFEELEEEYETDYQLHRVDTIGELFEQYEENADLFNLALNQIDNDNNDVNINGLTIIHVGDINWQSVAYDFFGESGWPVAERLIELNIITAIAAKHPEIFFDDFVTAFDQEAQGFEATAQANGEEDKEVEAWKQWKELHANPFTGEIESPRDAFEYGYPHRTPEPLTNTGWEFEYPTAEQVTQWRGVMPASVDPLLLRGEPVKEMIKCIYCDGTGESNLRDGPCNMCLGEGVMEAGVSFPSIEKRREIKEEEGLKNAPAPAAWLREDPATGQFFFSKKKKWDMTPLTFADQLKNYVASIEPKLSHSLSWVKGGKGRGLMLNDGTLVTWPVDKKGNPQHPDMYEYLTGEKLPPAFLPEHFTEGTPFDIYEDGTLAFFSNDVPADLISDLSKIDYRLKTSAVDPQTVLQELQQLEVADQAPRNQYMQLIQQLNGDWQAAQQKWIAQGNDPNDMFGDISTGRGANAKTFIQQNIETIKQSPEATKAAWLLVQHMDYDVQFQQWFLQHLNPETEDYKYLSDRVNVNTGQPQQYGTQNVENTVQTITAKKEFTKEDAIELLEKNNWNFDANEFFMGMNDELEHEDVTHGDPEMTAKIVADHLREHPDYYTQLRTKISSNDYDMYDFHFNCNTGKKCFCRYDGISKRDKIMRKRYASQTVRKVKNQKQKFLQNEKGEAILDFLHRLISGHGIEERGEFGEGQFPGLEKMVPWIVKQIKTGYIRPEFDPDGKVTRMRYFYGNEEAAKREIGKVLQGDTIYVYLGPPGNYHNDLKVAVERKKGYGYKIDTGSPEEAKVAVVNAHDLSYEQAVELIESLPGQIDSIYMIIPSFSAHEDNRENFYEEDRWKQLPERYKDIAIGLMSPTRSNVVDQALSSAGQASLNENPDISKVPLSAVGDENFMAISWGDWADWFNAPNSPARRSRSEDEVRGAINRGIKRAQYLNERHNQDIDLTPNWSNHQLLGLIAEQLGVEYQDLYSDWMNVDRDRDKSLNDVIKELVQKYNRNIDQMKPNDVVDASRQHARYIAELEKRERLIQAFADTKDSGVVYRITDPAHKGWTVHQIKNREEAELESEAMGHCIGNEDQVYAHNIDIGNIEAFSLRDEDGLPKLTWHYNPDGTLGAIQGKSNNAMPQFRHMVTEFNEAMNRDDDDGGPGSEDGLQGEEEAYIQLPDPDTISEYVAQVLDPWEVAQEVAEYEDLVIGEGTEYERGNPDWDNIAEEFVELNDINYHNNAEIVRELFDALAQDSEVDRFMEEVRSNIEYYEYDPEDYPIVNWVKLWDRMNYNKERNRVDVPRRFYSEDDYQDFVESVKQNYGYEVAKKLPKWDDLTDVSGLTQATGYQRYLPANFIPQAASYELEMRPDICPTCGGKGYNYGAGQNISEAKLCPTCNGEGIVEFSEESMPQELWEFNAPVAETPIETADWSMLNQVVCDICKGQGRIQLPKPFSWYPDQSKQCEVCGGTGHKTAKLSLKEKAAAWDKPFIKLTYAQAQYIDGKL